MQSEASGTRFPLRGYERTFTMAEHGSLTIVHAMAVRGSKDVLAAFLAHLPHALVLTFNRHPRMRGMQVRDRFATAEIQPKITLETVSSRNLLEIREISGREGGESESWETFVEQQWHVPFDRYEDLPFYVRVWQYQDQDVLRVLLFCDHFMSDGISGMAILNDITTFASELSRVDHAHHQLGIREEELPFRPSLYDMWLGANPWRLALSKFLVKLLGKIIYVAEVRKFRPVIAPRAGQADLAIPITINTSSALFSQGTPDNMKRALQRCKDEGVTFFGALAAAVVVAYSIVAGDRSDGKDNSKIANKTSPFKLTLELPLNMRKRMPSPAPEVQVGAYMIASELESFAKEGVELKVARFWDLARKSKQEVDELLQSFLLPLPILFLDKYVNTKLSQEFLRGIRVPHSLTTDINISNIGKYGYTTSHAFQTAAGGQLEHMTIDSIHVSNSIPHAGSAAAIYVTSTDKLSYGFMHKYDDPEGKRLFDAMVATIERIGSVGGNETMVDVAQAVQTAL